MKYKVYKIFLVAVLSITMTNCAKRGRPTGGLKDSIPPLMVSVTPNHKSINFVAKKVKISFDEYIKLKDINKQLIISPPLKYPPEISPVGTASKFINIKILDTLKENTTYTFNFGNSIADNNEENELEQFKYVVSTGTYIDSLKINGKVFDAFNQETEDNISVMLYEINENYTDSLIYKEKPMYVTSTLDTTNFEFTNLKAGKYFMVAIKQPSNNYIYKPQQDKIGFLQDTITLPTDKSFTIPIFKEVLPFKMTKPKEVSKGKILFGYEGNSKDLIVKLLDNTPNNFKQELLLEKGKDSLNYWYSDIEKDSLMFEVSNLEFNDTLTVQLRSSKKDTVVLKSNTSSTLHLRDTFSISSNIPIVQIDTSKISLINKDSIAIPFTVKTDSYKTRLLINFDKEVKTEYNLKLLPKSFTDIFENANDTLAYKFSTKDFENYGNINLNVSNVSSPVIIQLITEKGALIASKRITESETIKFNNILPNKYLIRAIFDENNNGRWDTGNFLQKINSERVQYYETELETRENFDYNETFILK
jgi:uncharacterized protein (DUF2141 family)